MSAVHKCTPASAADATPASATLTLRADTPGPVINKNIYGQFAEHLGRCIYEGIWVGPDSSIPNTRGIRNDVVAALKNLDIPVLRWPGGCFADEYHWRDGIGPRDKRPRRPNASWGGVDTNAFGTHEFMELCEMLGADAYINGNVGSGTPVGNLDGIDPLDADNFLVSDWVAGKVFQMSRTGDVKEVLAISQGTADLNVDPASRTAYIPLMVDGKVVAYKF